MRDGKRNSNLSKGPKMVYVSFRGLGICHDYEIPFRDTTIALKTKSYVTTFDIRVVTFKLLVARQNFRDKYFYVAT